MRLLALEAGGAVLGAALFEDGLPVPMSYKVDIRGAGISGGPDILSGEFEKSAAK